jgi:hypothetical protein
MNALHLTSTRTRLVAFFCAVATSTVVFGGTVAGMQPRDNGTSAPMLALQPAAVSAPAAN